MSNTDGNEESAIFRNKVSATQSILRSLRKWKKGGQEDGRTVLYREKPETDILQFLNDVIQKTEASKLWHHCAEVDVTELKEVMKDRVKTLNNVDGRGQNALHITTLWVKNSVQVMALLIEAGCEMDYADKEGLEPIHYSAISGDAEGVRLFPKEYLSHGDKTFGRLPLHYAAMMENMDVIGYCLDNGTDINTTDNSGKTALIMAAAAASADTSRLLLERGATAGRVSQDGLCDVILLGMNFPKLGNDVLDQFISQDSSKGTKTVDITPILGKGDHGGRGTGLTTYQTLVFVNKEMLSHPTLNAITNAKWDQFAGWYCRIQLMGLLIFNLYWTAQYAVPVDVTFQHEVPFVRFMPILITGLGYLLIMAHIFMKLLLTYRECRNLSRSVKTAKTAIKAERDRAHWLTKAYIDRIAYLHGSGEDNLRVRHVALLLELVVFVAIDAILAIFTTVKIEASVNVSHEPTGDVLVYGEIVMAIVLMSIWLRMFWTANTSAEAGQFVIFTRKVLSDVGMVISVYGMLFVPCVVVFWHTIYRYHESSLIKWYDAPFIVLRMGFVDYDYSLGKGIADKQGVGLWWDLISIIWIICSALIILNLLIALMSDRYTILREQSSNISSIKRAEFVAIIEHFLGETKVRQLEAEILASDREQFTSKSQTRDSDVSRENTSRELECLRCEVAELKTMISELTYELRSRSTERPTSQSVQTSQTSQAQTS